MLVRNLMGRSFVALLAVCFVSVGLVGQSSADVRFQINSTYTGEAVINGFDVQAEIASIELELENMLGGWRGPQHIESQYTGLDLEIGVAPDAPNVLASAGPRDILRYNSPNGGRGALVTSGVININSVNIESMVANGSFRSTIMHEMFHAIGSGTLWEDFGLIDQTGFGYQGQHGLSYYQAESGNTFAGFVPLESSGGAGTAGGHWEDDDPYFVDRINQRQEINTGTQLSTDPSFEDENAAVYETFISNVTLGSFRDIGYLVPSLGGAEFEFGANGITFPQGSGTKQGAEGDDQNQNTENGNGSGSGSNGNGNGGTSGFNPNASGNGSGSGNNDPINGAVGAGEGFGTQNEDGTDGVDGIEGIGGSSDGGGVSAVPEPSTALILGLLAGFGVVSNRRRKA